MGTMVFLMANGAGPWSLDNRRHADAAVVGDAGEDDEEEPPRKRK